MSSSAQHIAQPLASMEHKILQDHREDLVSEVSEVSQSTIKRVNFSAKLCRSGTITQEVHEVFAMLDDTLEPELRLRYLVQCVCEGVKHDVAVFDKFLKVLSRCGGGAKQLASNLRAESLEASALDDGAAKCREVNRDIYLLEDDVPDLMEILVEVSDKWEEFGIALHLPQHSRRNCKGSSIYISMANILCEWISLNKPEKNTLKSLQLALTNPLVGRLGAAKAVEKRFRESQMSSGTTLMAKPSESESPMKIIYQSKNIEVTVGKSTLIEVIVGDSEGVCYHWMKEGQFLIDGLTYSGAHSAMLAIRPSSQATEGDYSCHIMRGSEEVTSKVVSLSVKFPPDKQKLVDSYTKSAEVPEDSWPPKVTNTFINLALITKKKELTDDYKFSIRGDMDDITETKEKIEFAEVFGEYERGALVLVEGRPGSGKTTLMHKVSRDWATGGKVLKNAKLVFLIRLRSLANRKTKMLSDILELFYHESEECEKVVKEIKQSNGDGICFIIDGLDEFHPQDETKSIIHQLLYDKYLSSAMIIVASRPVATGNLRSKPHVTKRIEVLGFCPAQILEYIDKYPFTPDAFNSASSPAQLKAYLNSHHNLLHMCYLPVHVAMICFLYKHKRGDIPNSQTKIYEQFTRFLVLRNQRRTNEDAYLSSLTDLHGEEEEYFSKICHLAWEMTIHCTPTVCQRDTKVPLSLSTCPDDTPSLGLVIIDRTAGLDGLDNTYAFLHLTFQEYLAACYLAKLKEEEQIAMIGLHAGKEHMLMVWKFYCGIVKFEEKVDQIISHITSSAGEHLEGGYPGEFVGEANLYAAQCAFESQQSVVCDSIVKGSTGDLVYRNCTLTLADMTAVCYVISTASHPVTKLTMSRCQFHADHLTTLLEVIHHNKLERMQTLDLSYNNIGDIGAAALSDGLKSCNNLQRLYLHHNNIGAVGAAALARGLKSYNNLLTLDLLSNNIGDDGVAALASGLKYCNNIQTLDLSNNHIGTEGAATLASGLKSCHSLQRLLLSNNKIGAEGAVALANGLESCDTLQSLWLYENNIGVFCKGALRAKLKCCNLNI